MRDPEQSSASESDGQLPDGRCPQTDSDACNDTEKACVVTADKPLKKLKTKKKKPKAKKPKVKRHKMTKKERKVHEQVRKDLKIQAQIENLLSSEEARDRFSLLDTVGQRGNAAAFYAKLASQLVRRKVYVYPEDKHFQPMRLLLAYCAELGVSPELFIKAQLEMLGGFFRAKRIAPKLGVLTSDKALDRFVTYLDMQGRSHEKSSELEAIVNRPEQESDYWLALTTSVAVMQKRLARLCAARGGQSLTDSDVVAELEMMARAGLVSNVYVALHRLADATEYLTAMKITTLEKLNKELGNAFYIPNLKQAFRSHLVTDETYAVMAGWLF